MKVRYILFALLVVTIQCRAEDEVRSTQEELRRRNIFFGDIDGRRSSEYSEAVRRYQLRKGLTISGKEDRETLQSLGVTKRAPHEPPPKELEWPEETVLKSDAQIDVAAAANELAAETGLPSSLLASVPAGDAPRQRASNRSRSGRTVGESVSGSRVNSSSTPRFSFSQSDSIPADVTRFLSDYLRAVSRNDLRNELHFYADRVDYFGQRKIDRRLVEQSLRKYYQKWPNRSYTLKTPLRYAVVPSRGEIVLDFRSTFELRGKGRQAKGQTDNRIVINTATADPRIVSIEERRVRN
jgi:peptidoglycan hydrolase-like protein with peptidoglycan-binding domain